MKRLLFIILLWLITTPLYAFTTAIQAVCGAAGGGASCDNATDYAGDKADYSAGSVNLTQNTLYCISYQATTVTCSAGTWGRFFVAHNGVATDNIKGCVYTDKTSGSGAPGSSGNAEDLVACSAETTCATDTPTPTCTNGSDIGGTATKNAYYFVCLVSDVTTFDIHRVTTGRTVYTRGSYDYTAPPATLTNSSWSNGGTRDRGAYIEIE